MKCTCNSVRCICPTGHPLHRAYPHHCPYSPFNGSHIGIGKVPSALWHGEALACPSAHATDIETPGGPHGTCAGQHSSTSYIDEKKSKKCAQKRMNVPGRSVRWAHRAIGVASPKYLLAPRQELLRCSHTTCKLSAIDIVERRRCELELLATVAHW